MNKTSMILIEIKYHNTLHAVNVPVPVYAFFGLNRLIAEVHSHFPSSISDGWCEQVLNLVSMLQHWVREPWVHK